MCCSDRLRMPEVCSLFINFLKIIFLTMANSINVCSFGLGLVEGAGQEGWMAPLGSVSELNALFNSSSP